MDVQDGFIVGIFNYCDRWCDACAFTSRCRLFADHAEGEARQDPSLTALTDAPPRAEDVHEPPAWLQEILADAEEAIARGDFDHYEEKESRDEHKVLERRAREYCDRAIDWLEAHGRRGASDPGDPLAIVRWFAWFIASKVCRATSGLANDEGREIGEPADHDGSAKIALLAIERSHAAWQALATSGGVSEQDSAWFVEELEWLGRALDRAFPRARAFVRPGFDEPDAVARLEAGER
jgi:hypothetical protein